jgi:hypothetical protein
MGIVKPSPDERPDLGVPPRPDLAWRDLPPTVTPPVRRRGARGVVAVVMVMALLGSVGVLGSVVNDLSRPHGSTSEYKFLATAGGEPIRWNPCQPIHYVVNIAHAPAGSLEDVQQAVAKVSAATGISFTYDGTTDEIPQRNRGPYLPTLYGDRWAPVVIAWVSQTQTDIQFQKGDEYFAAVAKPLTPPDDPQFVSGWVAVNVGDPNPPGWSYPGAQGPTVLHELGHVMGLDHVSSQAELMEPSGGDMTSFGPGDLAGLERLGRDQGCLTTPDAP